MQRKLIYNSRFFRMVMRVTGWTFLKITGWTVVGRLPDVRKFVAIGAPHTSNWDFPLFMSVVAHFDMRIRFFGKHTLFSGPFGWLFYWLGGTPVVRDTKAASDLVNTAITTFADHESYVLGIAPEGTRYTTQGWKTGFYRIALAADVPILLCYLDASTKTIGLAHLFYPSGDMDKDIADIQAFYRDKVGVNPQQGQTARPDS